MGLPKAVLAGIEEAYHNQTEGTAGGRSFAVRTQSTESIADRVKRLRHRLGMTQHEFAVQFRIPLKTLQKWEQDGRQPEGPARAYLTVIERMPGAVVAALKAEREESVTEIAHLPDRVPSLS